MAAEEKITIKIDVDAHTAALEKTRKQVDRLKRESGKSSGRTDVKDYAKSLEKNLKNSSASFKKHFDSVDKMTQKFGTGLRKFLGLAIKGIIAEMAILSVTMLGVHALFATGNFLMKAYGGAMKMAAQGAAGLVVAVATVAAAMREQQAAMYAYRGKGAAEFGAGINQVRVAMRGLQMDQDLAGLGTAALNKAYAAMSKTMSTPQINASHRLFKDLMDFGSAGQDPSAAAEKVGAVIEAITGAGTGKDKKSLAQTLELIKSLGPEAAKALKSANVKTKEELKKLISSGELAKLGGVEGQFDATQGTLVGAFKRFKELIKGEFADFGLAFLEPAKVAMQKIINIVRRDIRRLVGITSAWGSGDFMDGLVNAIDKVSTFFVNLIQKWLPQAGGQFSGIADWWNNMLRTFGLFKNALEKYIEPAKAIERAFKPIWTAIKDNGIKNLNAFREGVLENQDEILEFGSRIGEIIDAVGDLAIGLKKAFFDVLPIINDVLKGITDIFKMLTGLLTKTAGMGKLGSMAPLLGAFIMSGKMKSTQGGVMGHSNNLSPGSGYFPGGAGPAGYGAGTPGVGGSPFYPTPTGAPIAPKYIMNSQGNMVRNTQGILPGGGMMAPKIDQFGMQTTAIKPTKENFAAMNKGSKLPFGKQMNEFKRVRMMARYNRSETMGAQKVQNFNNSAMARMGTSMALSYGSQFAPEEMRGAMALGGTVGAVNPMAGLAVAGLGGAMKAKGGGKGALAGLAGGAALGTMLGGPGVGTAVGAALGLVAGGIMGGINEMRARSKEAGDAAKDALGGIFKGIMQESYLVFEKNQELLASGGNTTGMKGSMLGVGGTYSKKALAIAERARAAQTEERFGFNALQGNLQNAPGPVGLIGRGVTKSLSGNPLTAAFASLLAGDAGLTKETGKNDYKMSMEGAGNSFIDIANSSIVNPMQMVSGALGAMVPDIMNVGALIGKIPGAERVGALFDSGIGKGIKAALGFNVKSGRREQEEDFLKMLQKEGIMTEDQLKEALKSPGDAVNQFQKDSGEKARAFTMIDKVNEKRLDTLTKMSGKSGPELEHLAKSLGVDLYDATMTFDDMLTKLKLNMLRSAAEMRAANQNTFMDTSIYDTALKKRKTQYSINDKTRVLGDQFRAGELKAGDDEVYQYLSGMSSDLTALHGGDALAAFYDQQQLIGKGGKAYTEGGALEGKGMEDIITNDPLFKQQQAKVLGGFTKTGAEQAAALLADNKLMAVGGASEIRSQIAGLDSKTQQRLLTDLESGNLAGMGAGVDPSQRKSLSESLETYGLDLKTEAFPIDEMDAVVTEMATAGTAFKDAVTEFTKMTKEIFLNNPVDERPEWMTTAFIKKIAETADTSSPRGKGVGDTTSSRLSQTMARHAGIDSQLTGKRNITSAYRTTNLGSINSDHIMGRAVDLTGQNLGQYARLTHANGGFAEFHGAGASRHLHAVPGPGPTGDTSAPNTRAMPNAIGASKQSNFNVTISVSGGANSSPNEIAQTVMRKFTEMQDNLIQRT